MKTKDQIEAVYGIRDGNVYGDLTVVRYPVPLGEGKLSGQTGIECVCKCGNKKILSPYRLISGDTRTCGMHEKKSGAYIGLRSGKLEIIDLFRKETKGGNQLIARVRCDCEEHTEKEIVATAIVQGRIRSCGCEWRKIPKVGDRRGMLVVEELTCDRNKWGSHSVICRCDCGRKITLTISKWNKRKALHCGCQTVHHMQLGEVTPGMVFGKLTVLETGIVKGSTQYSKCKCECGKEKLIPTRSIAYGDTKSCGCIRLKRFHDMWHPVGFQQGKLTVVEHYLKDHVSWYKCKCSGCGRVVDIRAESLDGNHQVSCGAKGCVPCKHGDSGMRLYGIYKGMRDRCRNSKSNYYKWYGGCGIKVCEEWSDWLVFKQWAITHGYNDELSIDRIDPQGDYCPDNCRWATVAEQNRNKRTTPHYEYNGKSMTIAEWERELKLPDQSLRSRLRSGWDFVEAVETPRFQTRGWRLRKELSNG